MLISMIFAWLTVLCAAFAAFKFIARISGSKKLNRFFHKIHIPFGTLMIIFGTVHLFFAGNPAGTTWDTFQPFAALTASFSWGTAAWILGVLLALTYLFRKQLKKFWMPAHRILTVAFLFCLIVHICVTGVHIFDGLSDNSGTASSSVSSSVSSTSSADSTTASSSGSDAAVTFSGATLKDGTYEGSAEGYSGTTQVTVTVSGGAVTNITVDSEGDSPQYFSRASSLLDTITNEQSLDVDAVSGATFSSAGIINAVDDALEQAVVSGTLQVNSIDVNSISRH